MQKALETEWETCIIASGALQRPENEKRLDKWRMQRPQAEFPLDYFPYHKVKLKREQSREQLWRALAGCSAEGAAVGALCFMRVLCVSDGLLSSCLSGTGPKEAWTTWGWSGDAASRDHCENLVRLAEHCCFWLSSTIMDFAFFFVIWAPAFALQVASVLKEGLKVNLK